MVVDVVVDLQAVRRMLVDRGNDDVVHLVDGADEADQLRRGHRVEQAGDAHAIADLEAWGRLAGHRFFRVSCFVH
jgi:hypothetical protein